ncbi:hypothetical protein AVEN_140780-1 [Araneus ventricosus]|uniref:Uncharacterized protein n=1 Tax=Araneus ventricosus TaxID=182803 RepID=A0A4Y2VCE2_ARAVE|nr:hypothetical protein AVEN_140780-1 [Araneus ventricosus]
MFTSEIEGSELEGPSVSDLNSAPSICDAFALEIEGSEPASTRSSISEDESSIKSFFSFMRETISSSLGSSNVNKSPSQHSKCSI